MSETTNIASFSTATPANERTILVIDDDPFVAEFIRVALTEPSWNILTALDGISGLNVLRNGLATGIRFDLIILDINLPDMDGYDVGLQIRRVTGTVPVVPYMTRSQDNLLPRYTQEVGFAAPLYKEMSPTILAERLRAVLQSPPHPPVQNALLERLQHKAAVEEQRVRSHHRASVALFATSLIERTGLAHLLSAILEIKVVVNEVDFRMFQIILCKRQVRVEVVITLARDAAIVLSACQEQRIPVVVIANSIEEGLAVIPILPAQSERAIGAGLIIADLRFSHIFPEVLDLVLRGQQYRDAHIQVPHLIATILDQQLLAPLPARLAEVVLLDFFGFPTHEIVRRLGITPDSLRVYWRRVYEKLGLERGGIRQWVQHRIAHLQRE